MLETDDDLLEVSRRIFRGRERSCCHDEGIHGKTIVASDE